ncbi:YicC family protein [Alkalihalobacillus sp. MEB130]|uniref:YicC/YloC family endoribonuclease n=1 Tax=Alkalihalobacillus sp. MEB130 TaxID=2976704 RepID=UPI0028DE586F|nr:YicC/YloC family endoribonuclease [Alkalihalobacillus sp. MEB130]MDT8859085.1 YicC family protein [Alkalihalobacillus sp. MEB130]
MTGYGSATVNVKHAELAIEVKAVNHRFLELQVKIPPTFLFMEEKIRKLVKNNVVRGKVDVFIHINENVNSSRILTLDEDLLEQYKKAAILINNKLGQESPVDVSSLLLDSSLVKVEEVSELDWSENEELVLKGVQEALGSFNEMRETEGRYLLQDMRSWLEKLIECCDEIERVAPLLIERYREKIEGRIRSYINEESEIDETRLLTEVAIFTEKMDISEELVRMRAHVKQYENYLTIGEAMGRRLDFLIQEMNREVNTIGSKAADSTIRQYVVEMKGFLEKLKEQVQNVE